MHPAKLYPDDALRAAIAKHCWGAGYRPGHPLMSDPPPPPPCWVAERAHARRGAAKPTRSVWWALRSLAAVTTASAAVAAAVGCAISRGEQLYVPVEGLRITATRSA